MQHVSLEEGVMAMANTRSKWMDTPERSVTQNVIMPNVHFPLKRLQLFEVTYFMLQI